MPRQPIASTSTPPTQGPSAIAADTSAPQMPIIRVRVGPGGNASVSRLSELGMKSAAPTPWARRAATSAPLDCAAAHSTDAPTNSASPAT